MRVQTGLAIEIFQDIRAVKWGDRWKQEILESLDEVYFLVPVITPGYFSSDVCREEYEAFKQRQTKIRPPGRGVILPIYYVETDELSDPAWRNGNPWAMDIGSLQLADWRSLRLEPWESGAPNRAIEAMARQFKEQLKAMNVLRPGAGKGLRHAAESRESSEARAISVPEASPNAETQTSMAAAPRQRHRELVVDASGNGQFTTIREALRAAETDDVILVRPGTYHEGILLDKSLTLAGEGPRERIIVEASGASALTCAAPSGRVANLVLRQAGGVKRPCVEISVGRILLEQCDISSRSYSCVAVHGSADPIVRCNRIHDGAGAGILVYGDARGTFDENDVFAMTYAGIEVQDRADPTARHNRVHGGRASGIFVHQGGRGTFDDNDVYGNIHAGIAVKTGADPILRRNRISENGYHGVWVYEGGRGTFVENDLDRNKRGAWNIASDCAPHVKREGNVDR